MDSEAHIKQQLTFITSLIVRMRDRYCCLCGSNYALENGHFWHRDMPPTEFDLDNCNALCARCNSRAEYQPQRYRDFMFEKLGERGYADLADKAHSQTKLSYIELTKLLEERRGLLKEMRQ